MSEKKPKKRKTHQIPQPPLREIKPNERYVKTAGLTFILPNIASEGEVLSKKMADFLNVAYHTAILNRFSVIRQTLLESPHTTYEDLDDELRAFFTTFSFSVRPNKAPRIEDPDAEQWEEELQQLITYSRPMFRKVIQASGQKLERKDYEATLRAWVIGKQAAIQNLLDKDRALLDDFVYEDAFITDNTEET